MSPFVYYVPIGAETPGEPRSGWYFVAPAVDGTEADVGGPYYSADEAKLGLHLFELKQQGATQ